VISGAPDTEAPGDGPPEVGMSFVDGVVSAVTSSPAYAKDALVIVTHLTSGGFYDHVPPPAPLPVAIDSETGMDGNPTGVPYGPRVPLLALGPFVRPNTISHAPLELSSLAVFLEWNWLGPTHVGIEGHRDQVVANIGSLLDPTKTGVAVPAGALRAP
jgi:phospholipase C